MFEKDLITAKQAGRILGRSPSAISRALKSGRLEYIDADKRLLYRPGLEQRYANKTRPKADCPQKAQRDDKGAERFALLPEPPSPPAIATDYWSRVAQKMDLVLDCSSTWPRYDAHRLMVFSRALDEIRSQVEAEGLVTQGS